MGITEIKRSIQQLKEHYAAIHIDKPFREVVRVAYSKQVLDKLDKIVNENTGNKQLLEVLQAYLAENWALINNTSLGYTALPEDKITLLLCDIAEFIAEEKKLTSIAVLMPGLAYESIRDEYDNLTGDIKRILKTHIIGEGCQHLLPVKLITELDLSPTPTQLGNPYYDYGLHADKQAFVSQEEYRRLVAHSQLTQAVFNAKQAYELLTGDTSNLLGQLTQLCRQLGINMAGNLGEEDNAGSGAYPAIITFMEYYNSLDESQKETIPPALKQEIEKLYSLVTDKTRNINATENTETCIATRRASLTYAMSGHDEALSQISLHASKKESFIEAGRTKFELVKNELISSLKEGTYAEGHDLLAINMSLLEELRMPLSITSLGDLSILQELTPDEIKSACAKPNLRQDIIAQLRNIENLVVFAIEASPDKLEAFLTEMKGDIVQAWIHSFDDISALLLSLDLEKTRMMIDVVLHDALISMMQTQGGLHEALMALSPEQCAIIASSIKVNDKAAMLAMVKQDGVRVLEFASEGLRADKDFMLAAMKQDGFPLQFASEELKADKDFMLAAVKQLGFALRFASDELKADKEVVLAAVKQHGFALEFASEELKADKEVVLAAVKQDGVRVLEFASEELKNDWSLKAAAMVPYFALVLEHPEASKAITLGLATSAIVMYAAMDNGFSLLSSAVAAASSGSLAGTSLFKYRPHDIKNNTDDAADLGSDIQGPT